MTSVARGLSPDSTRRRQATRWGHAGSRPDRARLVLLAGVFAAIAASVAVWWWAVTDTDLTKTAGLGLVNAFPVTYYVALGLVLAAAITAILATPLSRLAVGASLTALILVIYGTPAVLYAEPQYSWTYKHLGVIRYLELHGSTERTIDVYQNWPGLFAANAWLARATGMDPGRYAAWAPVFFELSLLAGVIYAFGGFITDPRRRYGAALLWLLGSWVGQDYLSPQAMSIVLVVVIIGVALRVGSAGGWSCPPRTAAGRGADALRARGGNILRGAVRSHRTVPAAQVESDDQSLQLQRERRVAAVLVVILGGALITSHQLSPVMLIVSLAVLVGLTGWRRLWPLVGVLAAGEIFWVILAWPSLVHLGLIDVGGAAPTPPVASSQLSPLPGVGAVAVTKELIFVAFGLMAIAGTVRMLRRVNTDPSTAAAVAALAVSPYLIVPIQSYGGEVLLRAYLFSLPWFAVLSLEAIWPSGVRPPVAAAVPPPLVLDGPQTEADGRRDGEAEPKRRRRQFNTSRPWLLVVVAPVLAAALIVAYFGLALVYEMGPSDVAAATWLGQHVPQKALVYPFSENYPGSLTANYPSIGTADNALTDRPAILAALQVPGQQGNAVRFALRGSTARVDYILVTPSMRRYDLLHGVIAQSDIDAVIKQLRASRDFSVVFDQGGAIIFRYVQPSA